ncbi:MAG: aldehyde dehydrogenase (NADP(+)) [Balneolaceae bacterium]
MIEGTNLIGVSGSKESDEFLQAYDPSENRTLPEKFYIASEEEVDRALEKAKDAFKTYSRISGKKKADFLDAIAEEILALGDTLIKRASAESGLPNGRFEGERGRTVNQIRMFAELLREGSWVDARIDTAKPDRKPIPKADIRNMLFPMGPVVVFGASNFPLAFSTAGGDTASALAAGCPVVVKAHESHPGTNELVSRAILKAAEKTGMPDGVFSSLNGKAETGQKLVQHPYTKAIGFTGSLKGGSAIYRAAAEREEPIPVYAEMGSINPVFLLNEKLQTSAEELAETYSQSVTLGKGQFCTKPGLIIGQKGEALDRFSKTLAEKLTEYSPGCMLNPGIMENYRGRREEIISQEGVHTLKAADDESSLNGASALASVDATAFLKNKKLSEEVFGPFTLIVECENESQILEVATKLEGQLTVTLMGNNDELKKQEELVHICHEKAGRIIFNGVPTGVEVCHSMQHGGPWPATSDSKFTSVGTGAIRRFVRPVAYQDFPEELLPDELKPGNPLNIFRIVDGNYQK